MSALAQKTHVSNILPITQDVLASSKPQALSGFSVAKA